MIGSGKGIPRADAWLNLDNGAADVAELLTPPARSLVDQLELRPVSTRVGNVRFDDPQLLVRVVPADRGAGAHESESLQLELN